MNDKGNYLTYLIYFLIGIFVLVLIISIMLFILKLIASLLFVVLALVILGVAFYFVYSWMTSVFRKK